MRTTASRVARDEKGSHGKEGIPLRKGKILVTKSSAAHMRLILGVTPIDERLAEKALRYASGEKPPMAKAARRAAASRTSKTASKKR